MNLDPRPLRSIHVSHRTVLFAVLVCCLAAGVLLVGSATAAGAPNSADCPAGMGGEGTEEEPCEVTDADELQSINDELGLNYVLAEDIDASGISNFQPIGDGGQRFNGSFDGQGHSITGLTVDQSPMNYVGLFGHVDEATIRDVHVAGSVDGYGWVGGVVGFARSGNVTISGVEADVDVSGEERVGGVVGIMHQDNVLENSAAHGAVDGADNDSVGGLVGRIHQSDALIDRSFATGEVNDGVSGSDIGGLVGSAHSEADINDSYWDSNATGQDDSAGGTGLTTDEMTGGDATVNMADLDWLDSFTPTEDYPTLYHAYEFDGEGTAAEPYEVEDVYDLQAIRGDTLEPIEAGNHYVLVGDVDASGTEDWHGDPLFDGFLPIGDYPNPWNGTFDGNANEIVGLTFDAEDWEVGAGMFGGTVDSTLENVNLEDVDVVADARVGALVGVQGTSTVESVRATGVVESADPTGDDSIAGGLVGVALSDVEIVDSHAQVEVEADGNVAGGLLAVATENTHVERSSSSGNVFANGDDVGGLIGVVEIDASVTGSHSSADVEADDRVGGLIGTLDGSSTSVEDSFARGSVEGDDAVGGLAGHAAGDVDQTFAAGTVAGSDDVGGLIGNQTDGAVTRSYWDEDATGQNSSDGGDGLGTDDMTGDAAADSMDEFDYDDTWRTTLRYPVQQDSIFVVDDVASLQGIDRELNGDYVLVDDVDASETETWNDGSGFDPIGGNQGFFEGSFDGQGHAIKELHVDRTDDPGTGVFAALFDAEVRDLHLADPHVAGDEIAGVLVGLSDGTSIRGVEITDAHLTVDGEGGGLLVGWAVDSKIAHVDAEGTVSGGDLVGGLAGPIDNTTVQDVGVSADVVGSEGVGGLVAVVRDDSHLERTWTTGSVTGTFEYTGGIAGGTVDSEIHGSTTIAEVDGDSNVGGVTGVVYGSSSLIETSAVRGNVTGTDRVGGVTGVNEGTITETYASGNVTGDLEVGGLVGHDDGGDVQDSYWDVNATGQEGSAGGVGLTTAEMTGTNSSDELTGFDFDDDWADTDAYPLLQTHVTSLTLGLAETDLQPGETTQATVTLDVVTGETVTASTTADYESSDANVVTAESGTVEAHDDGDAEITATTVFSDTVAVSVSSPTPPPPPPPPAAPEFTLGTPAAPDDVEQGETFTVVVDVSNVGDASGSTDVVATVADETVTESDVELDDGESVTIQLTLTVDADPDTYDLEVEETHSGNVVSTTLEVEAVDEEPPADDDDDSPADDNDDDTSEEDDTDDQVSDDDAGDADDGDVTDDEVDEDDATDDSDDTDDEDDGLPGFGLLTAAMAILAVLALTGRHQLGCAS